MTNLRHSPKYEFGKKKPVISNTGNLLYFTSNVYNLYNNNIIVYNIKKVGKTVLFVNVYLNFLFSNAH